MMTKLNPTVYIVLTVFNWEKYFLEQLMSIYFQEYENWSLIIVDDWSTDSSLEVARKFVSDYKLDKKVKIIHQENQWTCKATENWLIEVQKLWKDDDYVTYCDADDIWTRDKLSYLVGYMRNNKCDMCFHDIAVLNENWSLINNSFTKTLLLANPYNNNFFELCIQNHISINLIFILKYVEDIVPIKNRWAKDYWTALILSLKWKKINYINKILWYYRRWHLSIQKQLLDKNNIKMLERDVNLFSILNEEFPNNMTIIYFNKYLLDRLKRNKKWCSKVLYWLLVLLKYPRIFFHISKNFIYKIFINK